ncbi:related to extracellular cellulase CelA/allergen Asp F7-like, putative [Fusarium oxysporum]|uniref:Related to extracellular cellulase CelA/allergen Asp F7-like, putative n=1 Tax=Fusarium oxysporum TaxID=5507 RepID=A0A2H3TIX5_FUSOX|nr:related to extracellular cellulase CelA/allergen Asp F7-like, putative [Fusarium oxysporum]
MKFFLPILLAAPAVMGRACKVRHSHSSAVEAVHTQYPVPEPVISQAPQVVDQKSSPVEVKTAASKPKTTKSKTSKPKKVSKPKASKPKTTKPSTPKTSTPSTGSSSKSTPLGDGASVSGSSTFYGGNLAGGNCMFSTYTLPSGILGTAFSGQKWDNSANCGACIEVTGPSGTIKAMIVDKCPECDPGHLDLFPDAFKAVGGTDGIVKTSYKFVECGITTPLVLHNKEGTSANWFSIQVVNANEPVKSVQVSTDGGSTWKSTERKDYNFFENPAGFGKTSVDVKVTSSTGKSVVVKNVGVTAGAQYKASSNF